ncbi:MAG TPA: hypothetical protein VLH08_08105 [Acidobacteriota bacterium]|nr:hypothetical protein [Acidobacteriota bacterium]
MGNGAISPRTTPAVGNHLPIDSKPSEGTSAKTNTSDNDSKPATKPDQNSRNADGLKHDPNTAVQKAKLEKAAGLRRPSGAELKEIRSAIESGKNDEAIKLTIRYYNIDVSGIEEIKYKEGMGNSDGVTSFRSGKAYINIGDSAYRFKRSHATGEGVVSPEWLATTIYHESVHAKSHNGHLSEAVNDQRERAQEIQALDQERSVSHILGLSKEMIAEVEYRRARNYLGLSPENKELINQKRYSEVH